MRRRYLLFVMVLITGLMISCNKNDDPTPNPNPQEDYSVKYSLSMSGEYDDMVLIYNLPGSAKNILTSVTHPWEATLNNYKAGDTVLFDLSFKTRPFKETAFQYAVTVNKDGGYIAGTSGSQSISSADTIIPVHVHWQRVIGN
jgi:hypothetical protein